MKSRDNAAALRSLVRADAPPAANPPAYPWRTRVLLPAGIVLAVLLVVGWSAREVLTPRTDVRVVPVVLRATDEAAPARAEQGGPAAGGGQVITQAAGWVEPDPFPIVASALADGVVRELLVLDGQAVRAGEVLARLIDDEAKLAVARAEAELAAQHAELTAAEETWANPIERDRAVAATTAAVEETQAELARLQAEVAAEQARAQEMRVLLERIRPSADRGAASAAEAETARYRLEAQRATAAATEARRPILEAQLRQRRAEATAAAEGRRLRTEEKRALESARAAVRLAEAQLAEARLRLERMEVRAPADGVVMARLVQPGAKLMLGSDDHASAHVARLYDPKRLQVRVDVPLADAAKVGVGAPAEVVVEALPGQVVRGRVTHVVHEADIAKNTLQFKVQLQDPPAGLKPEMLARVRFVAGQEKVAHAGTTRGHLPFVPEALIRREGETASVMVADPQGRAELRSVTLGQTRIDGWVSVTTGLAAGDRVIAEPRDVTPGERVRVRGEANMDRSNPSARDTGFQPVLVALGREARGATRLRSWRGLKTRVTDGGLPKGGW